MPIYEYLCTQCGRKFRKLVGIVAEPLPLECPKCRSTALDRQMSRFQRVRSEDDAMESMADEMESADPDDPKALRRMMRRMGDEMGEDMDEDIEQMMEEDAGGEGGDTE